ncbi:MAG: ABC transporter permease subunit/CPBP intramembrane protease [Planctomycetota bacterium]
MKWKNVKLIFVRELLDQLRDRRTLFTVGIMPLVLYPLMGMAMLQVAQFMREYPSKVWIVGIDELPEECPLVVDGKFNDSLVSRKNKKLLDLVSSPLEDSEFKEIFQSFRKKSGMKKAPKLFDQLIQNELNERGFDVAIFVNSTDELPDQDSYVSGMPELFVFQNAARDKSRIAAERVDKVLSRWRTTLVKQNLSELGIPFTAVTGIKVHREDVSDKAGKQAAIWSKILPFIVMVWCLTGAFYPAIDLCAGEKERGTFETLLSSPADRSEIAIGKLLTVMTFSMTTSILNLFSMGVTGLFVAGRMKGATTTGIAAFGAPPLESIGWLLLALIPISALFSAVALAAAAFARSSKEGQYYLVPLMMISMPLMMVPMLPGAKLDLGTSLIPVSGLMLMLRGLIEGQYTECVQFAGPVCAVTLVCGWFATRWVVKQFNSESVLFRASERFGVGSWVKHVMSIRNETPSIGNAVLCAVVILMAKFFMDMVVTAPDSFVSFAKTTTVILLATIAAPAVMMAVVLTKNPLKSLKFQRCSLGVASAAILAALFLNPLFMWFSALVMQLYPPTGDLEAMDLAIRKILGSSPGIWATILVIAAAPAVFEEVAYRGFILSGLEGLKKKWQAILLTSFFFGIAHGVIQQSIITFAVGMVIGLLAVQTRSIIPCILFHLTHNSLAILISQANQSVVQSSPLLNWVLSTSDGASYQYSIIPGIMMTAAGITILFWIGRYEVPSRTSFNWMQTQWANCQRWLQSFQVKSETAE